MALRRIWDAPLARLDYVRRAGRRQHDTRVVCVLGMHRSGTSALAGTLQEAGLYLGNVRRAPDRAGNPKGTRENPDINALHESILAAGGGSWHDPPARLVWSEEHRAERDRIVQSFSGARLWGFKDPRTALVVDFWRERLGDALTFVGIFRAPELVVASLLRRDREKAEKWFDLWQRHNEVLLRMHALDPFPLIEFVQDADAFHVQLAPVIRGLGLREHRPRFFDAAHHSHATIEVATVPATAAALYERLRAAQGGPRVPPAGFEPALRP